LGSAVFVCGRVKEASKYSSLLIPPPDPLYAKKRGGMADTCHMERGAFGHVSEKEQEAKNTMQATTAAA
jgi:hypothetical protein